MASVECACDCASEVCYMQVIIALYDMRRFLNYEERRGVSSVFVGIPEGKRPPGRHKHIWENNIKMDIEEVGGGVMDWIEVAQDRYRHLLSIEGGSSRSHCVE